MRAKLDQHFLVDESAADRIVSAAEIKPGEDIVEIGPGEGVLTRRILGSGARLTAVEIDERLAAKLEGLFGADPNFNLLRSDFLKLDPASLPSPCKIVSNLPYSMATSILQRLLPWHGWGSAVLMFQKEVAERVCARPGGGDYGVLSISVALFAEAERLFDVPPRSFRPPPKVDSSVLGLRRLSRSRLPEGLSEEFFFKVVRAAFSQRRKMAANSLAGALRLERGLLVSAMRQAGLDPEMRAERISLDGFFRLVQSLSHIHQA